MAIITVAREVAAFGEEISGEFARLTGYRYVDRDYIEKRLEKMGINPAHIARYDERRPGFWASLSQERDDFIHYLKTIMYEEAKGGNLVIVGRGATCVFYAVPSCIGVKFVAPFDVRVKRVATSYSCDEIHARKTVERSDHDRDGFHRYFFDTDWKNPAAYDLVLNSGNHTINTLAESLKAYVEKAVDKNAEKLGLARVGELSLATAIEHAIIYDNKIPIHFLEVDVREGKAILTGVGSTRPSIDAAVEIASKTPGIKEVSCGIQIIQEYSALP